MNVKDTHAYLIEKLGPTYKAGPVFWSTKGDGESAAERRTPVLRQMFYNNISGRVTVDVPTVDDFDQDLIMDRENT